MKLTDVIQTAFGSLRSKKSRSLLTMLGIVIGISSVILLMSIGRGAESLIIGQVATFGSNAVFIEPGTGDQHGPPIGIDLTSLKLRDVEAIARLSSVDLVSGVVFRDVKLTYNGEDLNVRVVGTMPEEQRINNAYPIYGVFFDQTDINGRAKVAVLGYKVAADLFGDRESAVGQIVKINRVNFQVIGIMEEQGTKFFQNYDNNVYLPLTTAQKDLLGIDYVNFISVLAVNSVDEAIEDIRLTLRDTHNLDNPMGDLSEDDFLVASQVEAEEIVGTVTAVLSFLLVAIAAISLVVGGIGIMNIMLVAVSERTKEVGLRKAVGAKYVDILRQFLFEALILTFTGALIGIFFGVVLSFLVSVGVKFAGFSDWELSIPSGSVLIAVVVAVVVGLVFGIYPARKAAKMDPIQALRYE